MKPTHRGSALGWVPLSNTYYSEDKVALYFEGHLQSQNINRTPSTPSRLTAKTIIWNRLEEVKQWHHSTSLENDPFFNTTVLQIKQLGSRWFSLILPQNWISRTQRHSRSRQTISMGQRGSRLLSLAMQYQQNQSEKKSLLNAIQMFHGRCEFGCFCLLFDARNEITLLATLEHLLEPVSLVVKSLNTFLHYS